MTANVKTHYAVVVIPAAEKAAANAVANQLSDFGDADDCFPVPLSATGGEPWTHWLGCPAVGPATAAALPSLRAAFAGSDGYEMPLGDFDSDAVGPWLAARGWLRLTPE